VWISEAAEAAGVNVETLRYYERRGLLAQPRRPAEGYRVYSDDTVQIVRFVKQAQDLGFSLDEIKELIRLRGTTPAGRERVREVAERKLTELERKMAQLRAMHATLRRLVAACRAGKTPECPILEAMQSNTHSDQHTYRAGEDNRINGATTGWEDARAPMRRQRRRTT
jgi:Hg(II)-responsive transcriptional regulator